MGDAADFRLAVLHGVEAFALARFGLALAARLAEVDVARQFAQDHDVQAGDHFVLKGRGIGQFFVQQCRAQVGEQAQFLADAQQPLLRPHRPRQRVVLRPAHGAEQDGIGLPGERQCCLWQGILGRVVAGAANGRLLHFDLHAVA